MIILEKFSINADYDLDIMKNQSLVYVSSLILEKLEEIFDSFQPDAVFVHGDTLTTMMASIASFFKFQFFMLIGLCMEIFIHHGLKKVINFFSINLNSFFSNYFS